MTSCFVCLFVFRFLGKTTDEHGGFGNYLHKITQGSKFSTLLGHALWTTDIGEFGNQQKRRTGGPAQTYGSRICNKRNPRVGRSTGQLFSSLVVTEHPFEYPGVTWQFPAASGADFRGLFGSAHHSKAAYDKPDGPMGSLGKWWPIRCHLPGTRDQIWVRDPVPLSVTAAWDFESVDVKIGRTHLCHR